MSKAYATIESYSSKLLLSGLALAGLPVQLPLLGRATLSQSWSKRQPLLRFVHLVSLKPSVPGF